MKNYRIITLGCRVNQCESDGIAAQLEQHGWSKRKTGGSADLVIVNTCAVTGKAATQSRQAIRQERRANPDARLIVTGCYAELEADVIKKTTGESDVVGHDGKFRIPEIVAQDPGSGFLGENSLYSSSRAFPLAPAHVIPGSSRTRPVLKIQDGCNAFCSYCIVPYARGRSQSMPVRDAIENIKALHGAGYHEVVLSGIHLGCYGLDLDRPITLHHILERIDQEACIHRVRLSSIEPKELTDDIIDLVARSNRFCRHFHIPMQSGDNEILQAMKRPYTAELFASIVRNIRNKIPDAAIGADVLVGFPGETDKAFEMTYGLLENLPLTYFHVFPFSPREGTPAAAMPNQIPANVKTERTRRIRKLGTIKRNRFYRIALTKYLDVLVEGKRDTGTGLLKGVSSNYLTVLIDGPDNVQNEIVSVKAVSLSDDGRLLGRITDL